MAQEQTINTDSGVKNIKDIPLKEGEIRPYDMVTVYSADADPFHKTGAEMSVHVALAAKLIEAGKATKEKPTAKKA